MTSSYRDKDWLWIQHDELAMVNPKKPELNDDEIVSFVPMGAVVAETGKARILEKRRFEEVKKGYTSFHDGDILFAKITPCMENGKVALVDKMVNGVGFGSTEFHVSRLNENLSRKFYLYYLLSHPFRKEAQGNMTGSAGQLRVPTAYFREILLPLPPVNEQHRIVTKIEELFSELDQGVESLKSARAQLKTYRQSLLKAAVEGRLTEQWRKENAESWKSAEQLLKWIQNEREEWYKKRLIEWEAAVDGLESITKRDKGPKKPKRLSFVGPKNDESSERLALIPKGWLYLDLHHLALEISQGWSPKCEQYPSRDETSWGVIKTTAIQPLIFDDTENKALPLALLPRPILELRPDDILITRAGPRSRVGICCRVLATRKRLMLCDKAYRLRFPNKLILPQYVELALNSPGIAHELEKLKSGINDSGVNLTQKQFLQLRIPVPPVAEQKKIVDFLDAGFSHISEVESAVDLALEKKEQLRQSILKRAFEGKLVPQDPNDEPASELLERIRQEQDEKPHPVRRRRRKQEATADLFDGNG